MDGRREDNDLVLRALARELRRIQDEIETHVTGDNDPFQVSQMSALLEAAPPRAHGDSEARGSWRTWKPVAREAPPRPVRPGPPTTPPPPRPPPRPTWNPVAVDAWLQQRDLAAEHRRAVAEIRTQNQELERAKRELGKRIETLRARPREPREPEGCPQSLQEALRELGFQGNRTQRQLQALRKDVKLLQADVGRMLIGQVDVEDPPPRGEGPGAPPPPLPPPLHEAPVYTGGRLSAEISALRMMYARGGGRDPQLLEALNRLLARAQALEMGATGAHVAGARLAVTRQPRRLHRRQTRRDPALPALLSAYEEVEVQNEILRKKLGHVTLP